MKVLISGSSGLVGSALCQRLEAEPDCEIVRLVRKQSPDTQQTSVVWNPAEGQLEPQAFDGVDTVVHLGGVNIAGKRWSPEVKQKIFNSRFQSTSLLASQLATLEQKPTVFLCASAVGFYGDRGEERLDESSPRGEGFLADVCQAWEQATLPAQDAGIRVVNMRFGMILDRKGGALGQMLTPFKMGVGGRLGSGKQYWSWIALPDVINALQFCLNHSELAGPVNFVAPDEVTNLEFTKTLGKVLSRPTCLPVPAWGVKTAFGEMGQELMLTSARVVPKKLTEAGFQFQYPQLEDAFRSVL
ncbi:TIGR01777 family oxidoreductase [Gimesia chilikensis]|uniref:TIGR01777 family oxidoreductase n=1 Tax=Gimesia chilikensis TaxID=2605989 RepID=UPI001187D1E3|nr:TIGR01777 family oxidoreductase [Gimesia chilikensis]QDT84318.1 Epimerase family protein [Gimesia chilikensis]